MDGYTDERTTYASVSGKPKDHKLVLAQLG